MYLILSETNIISEVCTDIELRSNGDYYVKEKDTIYPRIIFDVIEVAEIPEEVKAGKYCYTPEQGFYLNPGWTEPNKYGLPEETVQAIQDDTIANLIELGVL